MRSNNPMKKMLTASLWVLKWMSLLRVLLHLVLLRIHGFHGVQCTKVHAVQYTPGVHPVRSHPHCSQMPSYLHRPIQAPLRRRSCTGSFSQRERLCDRGVYQYFPGANVAAIWAHGCILLSMS